MNKVLNVKEFITAIIIITIIMTLFVFPISADSGWSKPRPSSFVTYNEKIENAYTDSKASVGLGVHIFEYVERSTDHDYLTFRFSVPANTRVGIEYDIRSTRYTWVDVSNPTGITQDDNGTWCDLPFPVLFYGVWCNCVWICSNGFLSFNSTSTSYSPQAIPNTAEPNLLIAPFWRDLRPYSTQGPGSITYSTIGTYPDRIFIISWNDVPNYSNGAPQSFQVLIFESKSEIYLWKYHNVMYFQYKSITKDYTTTVGVENLVGDGGSSYDCNSLYNGLALEFQNLDRGCRLTRLTIEISKSDTYAKIDFLRTYIGGYNVQLNSSSNPYGDYFKLAIEGAATVLIRGQLGLQWVFY
jgi:hypothetical protein